MRREWEAGKREYKVRGCKAESKLPFTRCGVLLGQVVPNPACVESQFRHKAMRAPDHVQCKDANSYWLGPSSYLNICKHKSGQSSDLPGREHSQLHANIPPWPSSSSPPPPSPTSHAKVCCRVFCNQRRRKIKWHPTYLRYDMYHTGNKACLSHPVLKAS